MKNIHKTMQEFSQSSYLDGNSAAYVEALYETFLQHPEQLSQPWRDYFNSLSTGTSTADVSHQQIREEFRQLARSHTRHVVAGTPSTNSKQYAVDELINAYRRYGHYQAKLNPLKDVIEPHPKLSLSHYHLSSADLQTEFVTRGVLAKEKASLQDIIAALEKIYTGTAGFEYTYVDNDAELQWLQQNIEQHLPTIQFAEQEKIDFLSQLIAAESLERFFDTKFPGQKRYSIEGTDVAVPILNALVHRARTVGLHELIIGMAHRGRLNVLLNVMGQPSCELIQEFDGTKNYGLTSGDVKYHLGFSSDIETVDGPVHLSLAFNPSHLEFINPVLMGSARARQIRNGKDRRLDYAMPVMIHGDAAFAGEGIVMETLQMSQTRAYHVGGSLHIIMNNQLGFTTSDTRDSRTAHYCSGVARMINMPVFHVNADDVEMAVRLLHIALAYRMHFHKDVAIELWGYRRHGHQEVDEPRATQPLMYKRIDQHLRPWQVYANQLKAENVIDDAGIETIKEKYLACLDAGKKTIKTLAEGLSEHYSQNWTPYINKNWQVAVDTTITENEFATLSQKIVTLPNDFKLQRNVEMVYKARQKMASGEAPLDWGFCETLAYASLLQAGFPIHFSGQDCRRGTFFHRHAVVFDQATGQEYMPLAHLSDQQACIEIFDSLLCESAALGFEYGYSTADPNALVLWEAQFGDFANVAQVYFDQFISSAWQKWNRLSGITVLLPHGYEGMGPEHSSARLERFLQLAAQDNMQVCVPTTPSQIFHLLRRQTLRPYRKPLIVLTPKSLLRHKLAVSTIDDLTAGQFQVLLPEIDTLDAQAVTRVIACSGKIYYDLLTKRRELNLNHVAIIRVEQLYPFPYDDFRKQIDCYPNAKELVWCQEEPKNQGAWFCSYHRLLKCKPEYMQLYHASREPSAAAAAGYPKLHNQQQDILVNAAFSLEGCEPQAV